MRISWGMIRESAQKKFHHDLAQMDQCNKGWNATAQAHVQLSLDASQSPFRLRHYKYHSDKYHNERISMQIESSWLQLIGKWYHEWKQPKCVQSCKTFNFSNNKIMAHLKKRTRLTNEISWKAEVLQLRFKIDRRKVGVMPCQPFITPIIRLVNCILILFHVE